MNTGRHLAAGQSGRFSFPLILLCCFALMLASCIGGKSGQSDDDGSSARKRTTPSSSGKPSNPNERLLAYGVSITLPSTYSVSTILTPENATRASLDSRRQSGERVPLLESGGAPSPRGIEPLVKVFVVNQEGTFMPREFAERMTPEEFASLSKDIFNEDKAEAKKKKVSSGLLDVQISRDNLAGTLAVKHNMLVKGPDGKPARLTYWDVYLPNGAGVAIRTIYDNEQPNTETEVYNIIRSLKIG